LLRGRGIKGNEVQVNDIEVVGLGALNIDHLHRVERILDEGEAVVKEAVSSPGGSAANTIYGLAKLGVSTGFIGVVGDDAEGEALLDDFQKVGVDTSQIRLKHGEKTGSVLCLSDSLGQRSLYVSPAANNLLTMDDLDIDYINQAKILHLASFADDRQLEISLDLVTKLDSSVKVSFTPGALYAAKGLKALSSILSRTHILFINRNEMRQLTGEDIKTGAERCLNQGCRIVAVTLGKGVNLESEMETSHGTTTAYIRDAHAGYIVESDSRDNVSQVDTTGAGDAFAAGFLYGFLNGKGPQECGYLGDIVARFSITKAGAREGLPTLDELSQRYQERYF